MSMQKLSFAALLIVIQLICTGCATSSDYAEAAAREERAADTLQQLGASEASRAARARAEANWKQASCGDFVDCVLDVLLSIRIDK